MATKLAKFDFDAKQEPPQPRPKVKYPWGDWLDGDIWKITEGEDFYTHPLMMERVIRTRATGRDATVQMRHVSDNGDKYGSIVLERTDIEGPEQAKRREQAAARAAKKAAKATERDAKLTASERKAKKKAPTKKAAAKKVPKKAKVVSVS